jgi:hypothetical protein
MERFIWSTLAFLAVTFAFRTGYRHLMSGATNPRSDAIVGSTPIGFMPIGTFTPLVFPTPSIPGRPAGGLYAP